MILINKTYVEMTPESAEQVEFSNSGFIFKDSEYSFRELIEGLEKHKNPSCSCLHNNYDNVWFSTDFEIDYCTMTERQESLHYSHNNNARSEKYWIKAINYVFGRK